MDTEKIANNIFHELNKILVTISKGEINTDESADSLKKSSTSNPMALYYLQFPTKARDEMAKMLGISPKTLRRIYDDPMQIINNIHNYDIINNMAKFFSCSYTKMISIFFGESSLNQESINQINISDSVILQEIMNFEKQSSREDRRKIARVIHMLIELKISPQIFYEINFKLINKQCYDNEGTLNRIKNFIDNS